MKRFFIVLPVLVVAVTFLVSQPASAHVLKVDGHIAAVLHINPDDAPVSGTPTNYLLFFYDNTGKFSLPTCNCQVSIDEHGQTVATQSIHATDPVDASNVYTFPKPDVYTVIVSGQPKQVGMFQPFSLSYLVRVGGDTGADMQSSPLILCIGLAGMVVLILLACYAQVKSEGRIDR